MTLNRETVASRLRLLTPDDWSGRVLVAFSGGLDSTVLLHLLGGYDADIQAVYVDHGVNADSASWAEHCAAVARETGVPFLVRNLKRTANKASEAELREDRYETFSALLRENDLLVTAHHRDDQAETLLLNLLRGAGVRGLGAMRSLNRLGPGWLVRPLLEYSRLELLRYADAAGLHWIEDPSNEDIDLRRNFLRHEIIPRLQSRWPAAIQEMTRSAEYAAEADLLLGDLAQQDLEQCGQISRLSIVALTQLSHARQKNLLRFVIRESGLPPLPTSQLDSVLRDLVPARTDAMPVIRWASGELRRYRDTLHILEAVGSPPIAPGGSLDPTGGAISLGSGHGSIRLAKGQGIRAEIAAGGLQIRYRQGGEKIRLRPDGPTRRLKALLQEEGVLPWMRDRVPLLYSGDQLVAVADLWTEAEYIDHKGFSVHWDNHPAIF